MQLSPEKRFPCGDVNVPCKEMWESFYFWGTRKLKDKSGATSQGHAAISRRALWLCWGSSILTTIGESVWNGFYEVLCPLCSKELLLVSLGAVRGCSPVWVSGKPCGSWFSSSMWHWTSFSGWKWGVLRDSAWPGGEKGFILKHLSFPPLYSLADKYSFLVEKACLVFLNVLEYSSSLDHSPAG